MKLLFVHDHIFLTHDGQVYSNTFSYTVLRRYLDVFSEITVVGRRRETHAEPGLPAASGAGVSFVFLESIASLGAFFGKRQQQQRRLQSLVETHDCVIARLPSEYGLMAAAIAQQCGRSLMLEVVGCAWDAMRHYGGLKARLYAPLLYWRMRRAVLQARYVSYVTASFLQERYPAADDAQCIAVSDIVLPAMDDAVLEKRIKKVGQPGATFTVGTIANLDVGYKGIDVALEALARVRARGIEVQYRVLGAGDPSRFLQQARQLGMEAYVRFDGSAPGGQGVFDWLDAVDLYLQPSFQEGLPRALIEAMSRGCPAIGAEVGGIPELLDTDTLFRHSEPQRLVELIIAMYGDSEKRQAAARRNFDVARRYQSLRLDAKRRAFLELFSKETGR